VTPEHTNRKWRVGIPLCRLHHHAPRGAVRAARAIAECLVADPRLEFLAISDPRFDHNDVVFESWELSQWLEWNPLATAPASSGRKERAPIPASWAARLSAFAVSRLKRVLVRLGLRRPAKFALRIAGHGVAPFRPALEPLVRRLGLEGLARRVWCVLRREAATTASPPAAFTDAPHRGHSAPVVAAPDAVAPPESDHVSLHDLDIVLSFECYDAIWDWPTELFDCQLVGMFFDAIPFRIHEGAGWRPGEHYCQTGKMASRAAVVLCISRSSEQDLHTFFPNSRSKSSLIHLGHDRERFLPRGVSGRRRAARRRSRGIRVAMIGELEPRKNQAGVLRACQHLANHFQDKPITLVLMGERPDHYPYSFLEQQASRNVRVEYQGYVSDSQIGDLLRSCDVFVFASLWEGFGIPVLEAMSAGVPVVCSENSSLPEVGGRHAFYCDPYDPVSIAEAISEAMSLTPSERMRWIEEARAWAGNFTWTKTAAELSRLLRELPSALANPHRETRDAVAIVAEPTVATAEMHGVRLAG